MPIQRPRAGSRVRSPSRFSHLEFALLNLVMSTPELARDVERADGARLTLRLARAVKQDDEFRYVSMVIARLQEVQVGKQIEDVKSRLRRLSPIKDADEYRALWGDLVALEEYRKALLQQSAGVL